MGYLGELRKAGGLVVHVHRSFSAPEAKPRQAIFFPFDHKWCSYSAHMLLQTHKLTLILFNGIFHCNCRHRYDKLCLLLCFVRGPLLSSQADYVKRKRD